MGDRIISDNSSLPVFLRLLSDRVDALEQNSRLDNMWDIRFDSEGRPVLIVLTNRFGNRGKEYYLDE